MKKQIIIFLFISFNIQLYAQSLYIESSAGIYIQGSGNIDGNISTSPSLHLQGNIQNAGTLQNNGEIHATANFANTGTFTSTGEEVFKGTVAQTISGDLTGSNKFNHLMLNKTADKVVLGGDIEVGSTLTFLNGKLDVANNDATMSASANIAGADATKYVVTSGTGSLKQTVGNSDVVFPIGNSTYNPTTLNNSGTSDVLSARVDDVVGCGGANTLATNAKVNKMWCLAEAVAGGSNLSIKTQWNTADEGSTFTRTTSAISNYEGTSFNLPSTNSAATNVSTDIWSQTKTGQTTVSPVIVTSIVAGITGGGVSFCDNTTATLTAPTLATVTDYQWKKDNTDIPFATNNTYAANQTGNYAVEMTSGSCLLLSPAVLLTALLNPNLVITDPASVCLPGVINLTAPAITAGSTNLGVLTYWRNAALTSEAKNPSTINVNGIYYIKAINGTCTDVKPVNLTINGFSSTIVNVSGTTIDAKYEVTESNGWTHYYNTAGTPTNYCDDYLLLSVKKNGNVIGTTGNGVFKMELKGGGGVANITPNNNYVEAPNWYVMNRYWDITPNSEPTSNVNVRFYYTQQDYDALRTALTLTAHSDMSFYKINASMNQYNIDPAQGHANIPKATTYSSDGYWQYKNGLTASTTQWKWGTMGNGYYGEFVVRRFSGGGGGAGPIGGDGPFLPITLVNFAGYNEGVVNRLQWNTSSELNSDKFVVQRSTNNTDFESIGEVKAKGNSNVMENYGFNDRTFQANTNYYRLKMLDKDGLFDYSNVVEIETNKLNVTIYPNPAQNEVFIAGNFMPNFKASLINMLGQEVLNMNLDSNNQTVFPLRNIAGGIYMLNILNEKGMIMYSEKLVKE